MHNEERQTGRWAGLLGRLAIGFAFIAVFAIVPQAQNEAPSTASPAANQSDSAQSPGDRSNTPAATGQTREQSDESDPQVKDTSDEGKKGVDDKADRKRTSAGKMNKSAAHQESTSPHTEDSGRQYSHGHHGGANRFDHSHTGHQESTSPYTEDSGRQYSHGNQGGAGFSGNRFERGDDRQNDRGSRYSQGRSGGHGEWLDSNPPFSHPIHEMVHGSAWGEQARSDRMGEDRRGHQNTREGYQESERDGGLYSADSRDWASNNRQSSEFGFGNTDRSGFSSGAGYPNGRTIFYNNRYYTGRYYGDQENRQDTQEQGTWDSETSDQRNESSSQDRVDPDRKSRDGASAGEQTDTPDESPENRNQSSPSDNIR